MAAIAYWLLQQAILRTDGPQSTLAHALGADWKGRLSPLLYLSAMLATLWQPWVAEAMDIGAALIWVVPDRRIERALRGD